MQLNIFRNTHDTADFILTNTSLSQANRLRRAMIAGVSTWAIDIVEFEENTTGLHNEYIKHRLSLIPLFVPDDLEEVYFSLDLLAKKDKEYWLSQSLQSEPGVSAMPEIVITKATRGQRLRLTAIAKKGTGSDHVKWSPVTICTIVEKPKHCVIFHLETNGALTAVETIQKAMALL